MEARLEEMGLQGTKVTEAGHLIPLHGNLVRKAEKTICLEQCKYRHAYAQGMDLFFFSY